MTTYEVLDRIADSVNPLLGVFTLTWAWCARGRGSFGSGWHAGVAGNLATLGAVAIIYGIGALDRAVGIWAGMGLDYSTHTAVCVAIIVSLWWIDRRLRIPAITVGVAYGALMLYQKYHSVADILTTLLPVLGTSIALCALITKLGAGLRFSWFAR